MPFDDDDTVISPGSQNSSRTIHYAPGVVVGGDYTLLRSIGRGGMGEVFAAEHKFIANRICALKILAPHLISERNWQRFEREARALARLEHPGIVRIYTMGVDRELCPYYVMELVQGDTLSAYLEELTALTVEETLEIFLQVAQALEYAHDHDIIHRDLKPSNIMILPASATTPPQVKLVDFGVAALTQSSDMQKLTEVGEAVGTPLYMSPEQFLGQPVAATADIYSFGCSLFQALTGKPPFRGATALDTINMHQYKLAPRLADVLPQGDFSADLEYMVARMLSKLPANRYQDMSQVIHDLERLQRGKPLTKNEINALKSSTQSPEGEGGSLRIQWWHGLVAAVCATILLIVFLPWLHQRAPAIHASAPVSFAAGLGHTDHAAPGKASAVVAAPELGSQFDPDLEKLISDSPPFNVPSSDNSGAQHFRFPKNAVVGEFIVGEQKIKASGNFVVPKGIKPTLYISEDNSLIAISKLTPGSVRLEVDVTDQRRLKQLVTLTKDWRHLSEVKFSEYAFEPSDLELIDALPRVNQLTFFSCRFADVDLSLSKTIKACDHLKLDVLVETQEPGSVCPSGIKSLIKALDKSSQVQLFEVHKVRWPGELTALVCLPNQIKGITFDRVVMTKHDLEQLTHKAGLTSLAIYDWPFDFADASVIVKTKPTIKRLVLTEPHLDKTTAADFARSGAPGLVTDEWTAKQKSLLQTQIPDLAFSQRTSVHCGGLNFRPLRLSLP